MCLTPESLWESGKRGEGDARHPRKALRVSLRGQHAHTAILRNQRLEMVARGQPAPRGRQEPSAGPVSRLRDARDKMRTEHLAGMERPRASEKDVVDSRGGSVSGWKQSTGNSQKPVLGTRRLPTRARGPGLGLGVCADNGAFSIYFVFYNKEMARHPPPPPISRGRPPGVRPGLRPQVLCPLA